MSASDRAFALRTCIRENLYPPGKGAEDERTAEWALALCTAATGADTTATGSTLAAPATLDLVDLMWTYSGA